jgi:hypothetical protein
VVVALGSNYTKSVVFIAGDHDIPAIGDPPLQGTGFIVSLPTEDPDRGYFYVVTAAHVVRPFPFTWVRFPRQDRGADNLRVDRWAYHPTADVAATAVSMVEDLEPYRIFHLPIGDFVGAEDRRLNPAPGDDVYFAGLLGNVRSMGERGVPMTRGGMVGALYQDGVPIRLPDDTVIHIRGHLIDCWSFGGFSDSPCFVRYISDINRTPRRGLQTPVQSTLLLGLVSGHFDLHASVALPDNESKLRIPVAAGIAVVTPAEAIRETIDDDDLVSDRE